MKHRDLERHGRRLADRGHGNESLLIEAIDTAKKLERRGASGNADAAALAVKIRGLLDALPLEDLEELLVEAGELP